MELNRKRWKKEDMAEFYAYESTLAGDMRDCMWEQRIVNTALPCYGRSSTKARAAAREIKKGDFVGFLKLLTIKTHFDSVLAAYLICAVKDYDLFESLLTEFAAVADNWASCDSLKFAGRNPQKLIDTSYRFMANEKPFARRIGLNVYFDLIKDARFVPAALKAITYLKDDDAYYVNMCAAWLLSSCFVADRATVLRFFESGETNAFVINKAISKCRDSYRVSNADKELLKKYRRQA